MKRGGGVIGRKPKARGYDASPERQVHGEQNALALRDEGLRLANFSAGEPKEHGGIYLESSAVLRSTC